MLSSVYFFDPDPCKSLQTYFKCLVRSTLSTQIRINHGARIQIVRRRSKYGRFMWCYLYIASMMSFDSEGRTMEGRDREGNGRGQGRVGHVKWKDTQGLIPL